MLKKGTVCQQVPIIAVHNRDHFVQAFDHSFIFAKPVLSDCSFGNIHAGAANQEDSHAGAPEDPEGLPLAGAEERVLVDDLAVGRDPKELAAGRRPIVLDLRTEPVGRPRAMDPEPGVALLRGELVEAVSEPPRGAAAEGRDRRARPVVRDARIEIAETAVLAAHRARRPRGCASGLTRESVVGARGEVNPAAV